MMGAAHLPFWRPRSQPMMPPDPSHRRSPASLIPQMGLVLLAGMPGWLPALARQEPAYPSQEELRRLQLVTFSCARDNRAVACEQARRQADPLLDHPRLPGSCKDALWQIREQAVVVPTNSFERRDQLDRAAVQMLRSCQAGTRPVAPSAGQGQQKRPGGFGLVPSN
jgi:hypothetical protein